MSETVKLIIEISEERYNSVMRKAKYTRVTGIDAVLAKGIPLDDVKAEIEQKAWDTQEADGEHDNYEVVDLSDVFEILDNIGKENKE